MVGEIRDHRDSPDRHSIALTGHLVFTTVHANNVVDVIGRFLNMGVEPYNFVSALNCILAQRLVRIIANPAAPWCIIHQRCLRPAASIRSSGRRCHFTKARGALSARVTGFRGRTAIHELLDLSDASGR